MEFLTIDQTTSELEFIDQTRFITAPKLLTTNGDFMHQSIHSIRQGIIAIPTPDFV